jgi:hypothetical protein
MSVRLFGLARVRKDFDEVANDRRAAAVKPIEEAGSLIMALVVAAMLPGIEKRREV